MKRGHLVGLVAVVLALTGVAVLLLSRSEPETAGQLATGSAQGRGLPDVVGQSPSAIASATGIDVPRRGPVRQSVTVRPQLSGRRLPRSFMGLSLEYQSVVMLAGNYPPGRPIIRNDTFLRLLRYIAAEDSGPPTLRIGGGSADDAMWNPGHRRPVPKGILFQIDETWVNQLLTFQRPLGSPVILALNFAQNDPALAIDWARAANARIGARDLAAFELGNEPDLYALVPRARPYANGSRFARSRPYDFARYRTEAARFLRPLATLRPQRPIAVPGISGQREFNFDLGSMLRDEGRRTGLVTWHAYPLSACPGNPTPTLPMLLQQRVAARLPRQVGREIQVARRAKRDLRITESNVISCLLDRPKVETTLAHALFMIDWLFEWDNVGAQGVDIHSTHFPSGPFATYLVGPRARARWATVVNPLYYGMLLFARATARRARLVRVDYDPATVRRGFANVKVWATLDDQQTLRVVVLNKDLRSGGASVRVRVPGSNRAATVQRLTGESPASVGVRLDGQRAHPPGGFTVDGRLRGRRPSEVIRPRHGAYFVRLPRPGAALLTIPR